MLERSACESMEAETPEERRKRKNDRERERRRKNKEKINEKDRERKRLKKQSMTGEEKDAINAKDRARKRLKKESMAGEEKDAINAKERQRERLKKESMTDEERSTQRRLRSEKDRERRMRGKDMINAKERQRKRKKRKLDNMSEEERVIRLEKEAKRRRTSRINISVSAGKSPRCLATKSALDYVLQNYNPQPDTMISHRKCPPVMEGIVSHLNKYYLTWKSDLKLVKQNVWRIYFRNQFGQTKYKRIQNHPNTATHRSIYIQKRLDEPKEVGLGRQLRKKPLCGNPLGNDYSKLVSHTTIQLHGINRIIYCSDNLHSNWHGSMDISDVSNTNILMDHVGIKHQEICHENSGQTGLSKHEDIVVAFQHASIFSKLERSLSVQASMWGMTRFEHDLTKHLLLHGGVKDTVRMNGKINPNKEAFSYRAQFGFGRIQPAAYGLNWHLENTIMPSVSTKHFLDMPNSLRQALMVIFEHTTEFTRKHDKKVFSNIKRNQKCAGYLNNLLGFPGSKSLFEYYDIVLSHNTILRKHCDQKNCHRHGYNKCCVYSFFHNLENIEYKVSIVMTTRTTIGSAFERYQNKMV